MSRPNNNEVKQVSQSESENSCEVLKVTVKILLVIVNSFQWLPTKQL